MSPLIAQDKANHIVYGGLVVFVALLLLLPVAVGLRYFGAPVQLTAQRMALVAQLANVLVAAWKEWVHDAAHKDINTVDPLDFLATVVGGLQVGLPVFLAGAMS